jgi:hypothetical protein
MTYMAKDKIVRTGTDIDLARGLVKVAKVQLVAADAVGGVFAWQNPEGAAIIVQRVIVDVTTAPTTCTIDVGTKTTVDTSDNLIDGANIGTAGVFDNIQNAGTNGKPLQRLASGAYVTGSKATGAAANLVGNAYIHYVLA